MLFQHFPGNGFDIWYSTYDISCPVTLIGRADLAVLELHIPFQNRMTSRWDGIVHSEMAEKQFDLSFTPFIYNEATFGRKGVYQTFDVHYHKSTLQAFAPFFPLLSSFLEKVERGEPASLFGTTRFLSEDMIRVIHDMQHFDFIDGIAPAFYESKTMELLIYMLRTMSGFAPPPVRFSQAALDGAEAARVLISTNLARQYTASELARVLGTNIYTLKTAFKFLFKQTLFQYSEQVRMRHASQLLQDDRLSVSQVAWAVGYTDVQNFSTAFKRVYSMTPREIKGNHR